MITAYNKGYFIFENIYDVFMLMAYAYKAYV